MMRWLFAVALLFLSLAARAETVELTLPNQIVARADFRPGDSKKPAVILLHGFLQTNTFPTIQRLSDGLSGEGYSVLAPTLTLGVTRRKQSLPCEAIHTHSMQDSLKEIDTWVNWLKARQAGPIMLVGHSLGAMSMLIYVSGKPDASVKKMVGVSIVEGRSMHSTADQERRIKQTREMVKAKQRRPVNQPFSFCPKMNIVPESLLSYIEWTPAKLLQQIGHSTIPTTFIMGGKDERLGPDWIPQLKRTKTKVIIIAGADHFMDGAYEFDLLDRVLQELKH